MSKTKYRHTKIGAIPEGWETGQLKELAVINELRIDRNYQYENIEYIDISSVEKGSIIKSEEISMSDAPSRAQRIIRKNDILISTVRPNLKHYAFVRDARPNTIASTGFAVVTAKKINPYFLYCYLTTQAFTDYLSAIADTHTSTYPAFNPDILENSLISFPEVSEQRTIAKILSDLDEKIELNHQMNKTLESLAQALFKHWFVDFEMDDSSNWEVDELGNHIEFIKGKKPSAISETCLAGYIPQILIENLDGSRSLYADKDGVNIVKRDESIVVMDGASSGRVEIGHYGILGSTLAKVVPTSDRISNLFLYYFLKNSESDINQNTTGTSIPHADKERIKKYQCHLPPKRLLDRFNVIAAEVLNKKIYNRNENNVLIQIRDSLLPKLISGKIRVGN